MRAKDRKIVSLLLLLALLLGACSGAGMTDGLSPNYPEAETPASAASSLPSPPTAQAEPTAATPAEEQAAPAPAASQAPTSAPSQTPTSVPSQTPTPTEPTCTLSISCATALDHLDRLESGMAEIIPGDGWLLPPTQVTMAEGESVFDILQRTCRDEGIHLEFSITPGLGTAYIEGIGNLYAFDCGDLSGWLYAVNGVSPNVGCSDVFPEQGDLIQWCYTCDLGDDVAWSQGL